MKPFYPQVRLGRQRSLVPGGRIARTLLGLLVALAPLEAHAQDQGPSIIRDSEIERTLHSYADPIFEAAGLSPKDITIYIVNDPEINAFVAEGQNLFMNTGTIMRVERPRQLIGIIAHETGHIAGGHLVRAADAYSKATVPLILGTLLGVAAMAAGGGEAGVGILAGGENIAQRSILAYSREQEAKADQAAVGFLDRVHESARGLLETFEIFRNDEILSAHQIDPYLQNHPLSEERIAALEDRVEKSPYKDVDETPAQKKSFAMMQAKLVGFIQPLQQVLRKYPGTDKSTPARYARAIAYYRVPQLDRAFAELDPLIEQDPNNPYFHELKGQILLENGRPAEAIPEHQASVRLLPDEPLFKLNLGQAMVATEDPKYAQGAIDILSASVHQDPDNLFAWDQLAKAYGEIDQVPMAEYATAEKFARAGAAGDAVLHARRALCGLAKGSPAARRAQDIIETTRAQAEYEGGRRRGMDEQGEDNGARKGPRCEDYGGPGSSGGAHAQRRS